MPEAVSSERTVVVCRCTNCKNEFEYIKNPMGGRPSAHCSKLCREQYKNRNRSYRSIAAHKKLQDAFLKIKDHKKRQGFLKKLFIKYARYLAKLDKALSEPQKQALTNAYLFKHAEKVIDPHSTKKENRIKSIYHCFIAFCTNEMKLADPYDSAEVIKRAGLEAEMKKCGMELPEPKKAKADRKKTNQPAANKDEAISKYICNTLRSLARSNSNILENIKERFVKSQFTEDELQRVWGNLRTAGFISRTDEDICNWVELDDTDVEDISPEGKFKNLFLDMTVTRGRDEFQRGAVVDFLETKIGDRNMAIDLMTNAIAKNVFVSGSCNGRYRLAA